MIRVVLASKSPARLATLRAAGITPLVRMSDVDEDAILTALPGGRAFGLGATTPADEVTALAAAKCRAVAASIAGDDRTVPGNAVESDSTITTERLVVIGCDSMLEMDGQMLGKPHHADVARRRIRQMRGRDAILWTGHHVVLLDSSPVRSSDVLRSSAGPEASPSGRTQATTREDDPSPQRWHLTSQIGAAASTIVHFADMTDAEVDAYVDSGEPLEVAGSFTIDGLGGPFVSGIEGDHHAVVGLSLPLMRTMVTRLGIFWPDLWDLRH